MNLQVAPLALILMALTGCQRDQPAYSCALGQCLDRNGKIVDLDEVDPETPEEIASYLHYCQLRSETPGYENQITLRAWEEDPGANPSICMSSDRGSDSMECFDQEVRNGVYKYTARYGAKSDRSVFTIQPDGQAEFRSVNGTRGEPGYEVVDYQGTCTTGSET